MAWAAALLVDEERMILLKVSTVWVSLGEEKMTLPKASIVVWVCRRPGEEKTTLPEANMGWVLFPGEEKTT
jgi:hypothetical protein